MNTGAINAAADKISSMNSVAVANTAASAHQAKIQRDWQEKQNAVAMAFNRDEAAKNRDWQEYMSNTAHQREVKDLLAAGLNPVLSAMGGNGAAVTSGATASGVTSSGAKGEVDTSANAAISNLLGSILAANTQIESANINARTQEAVAKQYTEMNEIVAQISAAASRDVASTQAAASKYAATTSAAASRYGSDKVSSASRYGADQSAAAHRYGSDQSAAASRYGSDTQWDLKRIYGNNALTGTLGTLVQNLMGAVGKNPYRSGK